MLASAAFLPIIAFSSVLLAQESPVGKVFPAGGKWTFEVSEDKFTGALVGVFELKANEPISDGIAPGLPSFVIMCGGTIKTAHWMNSKLLSPVVLGKPDIISPIHESQQMVWLRADGKVHMHWWNMPPDYRTFFVDKHATKELLRASDVRIQFRDASEHRQVAIFSPAGINEEMLTKACGNMFK
jgi:hypothetical protein